MMDHPVLTGLAPSGSEICISFLPTLPLLPGSQLLSRKVTQHPGEAHRSQGTIFQGLCTATKGQRKEMTSSIGYQILSFVHHNAPSFNPFPSSHALQPLFSTHISEMEEGDSVTQIAMSRCLIFRCFSEYS